MWLLSNFWKFLLHILYTFWAGPSSLMCWFSLILLYEYETGIRSNFEVRLLQMHIVICYLMSRSKHFFSKFSGQNWELSSIKLTRKACWCAPSATRLKTGNNWPKTAQTADACMLSRMQLFVCDASNVLRCSRYFCLKLPVLSSVADPVTVHTHE